MTEAAAVAPLVSVVVPNYNHARFLRQRIESVLQQTVQDLEILLLDDCSTDDSRAVIARYAAQDARIRVVLNEQNSGSTFRQWNKGIALARGEYVWLAESDDVADPRFLERLLAVLQSNPACGVVYCDSWSLDEHGQTHGTGRYLLEELDAALFSQDFVRPGLELVRRFMVYRNLVPNASAVLLRRSVLQAVGPAPEAMRVAGDWWFWVQVFLRTDVGFVAEPLNYFRFHQRNVRSRTEQDGTQLLEMAQVLAYVCKVSDPDPVWKERAISLMLERWLHAVVYYKVPLGRQRIVLGLLAESTPGFGWRVARQIGHFLVRNRLSGVKMLIMDKLLRNARRV